MDGCLNVTGIDVRRLVIGAYLESAPGPMCDHLGVELIKKGELENIVGHMRIAGEGVCLSLDYVGDRKVGLDVIRDERERLWVRRDWPGHTELQLFRALKRAGWKEDQREA